MKDQLAIFLRVLLVALTIPMALTTVRAQGFNVDYLPFSQTRVHPLPLKRTALPDELRSGQPFLISGVQIQEQPSRSKRRSAGAEVDNDRQLVFSGRDLSGKPWTVRTEPSIYYEAVYEGDLDKNGVRDLVISIGTGGNGLAPPTRLLFLTFNRLGRPLLFDATGFFGPLENGIFDLADLDGDQRAELIYMIFDDGYWITNVYQLREARWRLVQGRFAGLTFPLYTRFTRRPNHVAVKPAPGRHPRATLPRLRS
jgi:hypothetical protein